jgi:hypothetical protein
MSAAEREALGRAGRAYFLEQFEMTVQAQRLIDIINTRTKETQR